MVVSISVVVSSFIFFVCVRMSLSHILPPPSAVTSSGKWEITWRWCNVCVSWVHSLLAGIGCMYCLIKDPSIMSDMNHCQVTFGSILVMLSTGYFLYDALDIVICIPVSQSCILLCHHVVVLANFILVIKTGMYVSIAVMCLLVEVNSVFLHTRQLLRMSKQLHTPVYVFNMFANLITFFVFRFITLAWIIRWIWINRATVDQPYFALLGFSLPLMYVINIGLFAQFMSKDSSHFVQFLKTFNVGSPSLIQKQNGVNWHANGHTEQLQRDIRIR